MKRSLVVLLPLLAGAVCLLAAVGPLQAAPPSQTIRYQGRLSDSNGKPLEGQVAKLTFRIYTTATPTSATFVWGEVHESVSVRRGVFTVSLGAGTRTVDASGNETQIPNPFTGAEFVGGPRFIEIQVDGDPPLSPLNEIGSVPFAVTAGTVEVGAVPLGAVFPWWPATPGATPPAGYEYCDGTAVSTPDSPYLGLPKPNLMGSQQRFVMGLPTSQIATYGGSTPMTTGGAASIGSHDHSLPNHTHPLGSGALTTSSAGEHDHGGFTGFERQRNDSSVTDHELFFVAGDTDHDHPIASGGAHSHTVSLSASNTDQGGSGTSGNAGGHDNRPPFVQMAFVVRVK